MLCSDHILFQILKCSCYIGDTGELSNIENVFVYRDKKFNPKKLCFVHIIWCRDSSKLIQANALAELLSGTAA